jgi:hypothetical protein
MSGIEFTGFSSAGLADARRRQRLADGSSARAARTARLQRRHTRRGPLAAFNAWLAAGQL